MSRTDSVATLPFFVDGREVFSDRTFESVNPANGKLNHMQCIASDAHVDAAVKSASVACARREWRSMLPHQRAKILGRISDLMLERKDELARLQLTENGKVLAECQAQVTSAASTFRYFAAVCETLGSEVTPSRGDYLSMTEYEPYGVVAAITPWNSPLTMEAQKVAPALAAGNAVVLKPSEVTPSTGVALARIAIDAGLAPGLLNVLTGDGTVGRALVAHAGVRMISFTGGTESGRRIGVAAAERLIPVALELGGKSPHIVFEDANVEAAIEGVCDGIFEGSGQSCVAGSRLFVQRGIFDKVRSALTQRALRIRVDAPDAPGAQMGPIASFAHRERIESFVRSAKASGGEILVGGSRPGGESLRDGAYFLPTIIAGVSHTAEAAQQEIFGPVLCIFPFDGEEDLVSQANDSPFGLAAGIWTLDYQRAWRVALALQAGSVWINTYKQLSISTPFGGFKASGIGREKGISGVRLYQQSKSIYWSMNPNNIKSGFTPLNQ